MIENLATASVSDFTAHVTIIRHRRYERATLPVRISASVLNAKLVIGQQHDAPRGFCVIHGGCTREQRIDTRGPRDCGL